MDGNDFGNISPQDASGVDATNAYLAAMAENEGDSSDFAAFWIPGGGGTMFPEADVEYLTQSDNSIGQDITMNGMSPGSSWSNNYSWSDDGSISDMFPKPSDSMCSEVMGPDPFLQRPADRSDSRSHHAKNSEGLNDSQITSASRVEMVSRRAETPLDTIILERLQSSRKSIDTMKVSTGRRGRPRKNNEPLSIMRPEKSSKKSMKYANSSGESSKSRTSVKKDMEEPIKKEKDSVMVKREPTRNKDGSIRKQYTHTGRYTLEQKERKKMEREAARNQRVMESKVSLHQGTQMSFDDFPRPPKSEYTHLGDDLTSGQDDPTAKQLTSSPPNSGSSSHGLPIASSSSPASMDSSMNSSMNSSMKSSTTSTMNSTTNLTMNVTMNSGLTQQQSPPIRQMIDPVTMASGHNPDLRLGGVPGMAYSDRSGFGMTCQGYSDYSPYQPTPTMMSRSLPTPPTPQGYSNPPRVFHTQGPRMMDPGLPQYHQMPMQNQADPMATGCHNAAPHQRVNTGYMYSPVPGPSPEMSYTNTPNNGQGFGGQTYSDDPFNLGPNTGPVGMR